MRKRDEQDSSDKVHDFRKIRVISLQNALHVDVVLDDGLPLGPLEQQGEGASLEHLPVESITGSWIRAWLN